MIELLKFAFPTLMSLISLSLFFRKEDENSERKRLLDEFWQRKKQAAANKARDRYDLGLGPPANKVINVNIIHLVH